MTKDKHLLHIIKRNGAIFGLLAGMLLQHRPACAIQYAGRPADTLDIFRAFISVCQSYQRLPLQLELEVHRYTNLMTSPEDTISQQAVFYLGHSSSCILLGDVEQLGSDSMMVIVSNKMKRMLVYRNTGMVENLLARFVTGPLTDSSLAALGHRYEAVVPGSRDDTARLVLNSRQFVYGSLLPKEEITAFYNKATKTPYKVVQLRRSLVEIDPEAWKDFQGKGEWEGKLVKGADSTRFVIKELRTEFCYRRIAHDPAGKPPILISDRIVGAAPGQWQAARGYEDFMISEP